MKFIIAALSIIAVCLSSAFSQTVQNEPKRFSYHIWGSVSDENSRPLAQISVCFIWVNGPLTGRLPCTKTDFEGNYALTVKGVPDKYIVSASTPDRPLINLIDKGHTEKDYRVKYSEQMEFGAKDECRKVTLQFDAKQTVIK